MIIEPFWYNIPHFLNTEKGSDDKIGYGYVRRHRYYGKNGKRKARRQIRKQGFDDSEVYCLDYTFARWMSDEFGGVFRLCGDYDNWSRYSLEGNKTELQTPSNEAYTTRYASFKAHLGHFLSTADKVTKEKIKAFCSPRLRLLAKMTHGHPFSFKSQKDWSDELNKMADAFDNGTYTESFITNFFSLWVY